MKRIKLRQGTKEWLDWRLNGITATEAACALGVSPWGTALSVYNDKLDPQPHEPSEYEEWGSLLEDVIKFKKFAKEHPEFEVRQGDCYEDGWRKCSLDGELYRDGKCVAILEIKTSSNPATWAPIPEHYIAQVQWQMHVTGIHKVYFAVLANGHSYFERTIDYDAAYCKRLEQKCAALWEAIGTKTPPAPDPDNAGIDWPIIANAAANTSGRAETYEIRDDEYTEFIDLKEKAADYADRLKRCKLNFTRYLTKAKYLTHNGMKFGQLVSVSGRETVDINKLKCDYPSVYIEVVKRGKPSVYPKFG